MKIKFKKLDPSAKIPTLASAGAGAYDLYACTVSSSHKLGSNVWPGYPVLIGTGISVEIPDGWRLMILSRSGHGFNHNTRLVNALGLIDSDYRGEVKVKLDSTINTDPHDPHVEVAPLFILPGDRVAQCYLERVQPIEWVEVDELSKTERGAGGFGSTGA